MKLSISKLLLVVVFVAASCSSGGSPSADRGADGALSDQTSDQFVQPDQPEADGDAFADLADAPTDRGVEAASDDLTVTADATVVVDGTDDVGAADALSAPLCDPAVGLIEPMEVCSAANPCTDLLELYPLLHGITTIDVSSEAPTCATSQAAINKGRLAHDDGAAKQWTDPDGVVRYYCEFRPDGTSSTAPRPLVIYIHGSGGTAADIYNANSLRSKAPTHDLSSDPARPGFILVSSQGRYLHWVNALPQDGTKHDTYHRDLSSPSSNRDVQFIDHIIDALVAEGVVEPSRIYLMGWSNGARFAGLYGVARHATKTPGGNNVAAVTTYSGGDPFENISDGYTPSCKQDPYPTTKLPLFMISRSCDGVACNEAHAQSFRDSGVLLTPGNVAETWIQTLSSTMADPNVTWRIITSKGAIATGCAPTALCGPTGATINHVRWPDGIADNGGVDHEPDMLGFLRDHFLP